MIRPRIADMITIASRLTATPVAEILGRRRFLHLCAIRHPIYVTAREWGYSYPMIGQVLDRDHSTVIHSINTPERYRHYMEDFDGYCEAVAELADSLPPFVAESDWKPEKTFSLYLSGKAREERNRILEEQERARKLQRKENSRLARSKLRVDYDMEVSARIAGEIKVGSANLLAALQAAA